MKHLSHCRHPCTFKKITERRAVSGHFESLRKQIIILDQSKRNITMNKLPKKKWLLNCRKHWKILSFSQKGFLQKCQYKFDWSG